MSATPPPPHAAGSPLEDIFDQSNVGATRLMELLRDPDVTQITASDHQHIFYDDARTGGGQINEALFANNDAYVAWLNQLIRLTDSRDASIAEAETGTVQGSFVPEAGLLGGIMIATPRITAGPPAVVVRKQPLRVLTLEDFLAQGMIDPPIKRFLELAIRGRLNILVSGGSGAGKTTMLRALFLSGQVDPMHHVITCEDGNRELHLKQRLKHVTELMTHVHKDDQGRVLWEEDLHKLVRHTLRMRPHRIIVGETRGAEAAALAIACSSGHDGSATTIHAPDPRGALRQLVIYAQMADMTETVARDLATTAFDIVVQINRITPTQRIVSHIYEVEHQREGNQDRLNELFEYDLGSSRFVAPNRPTTRLLFKFARNGVNFDAEMSRA